MVFRLSVERFLVFIFAISICFPFLNVWGLSSYNQPTSFIIACSLLVIFGHSITANRKLIVWFMIVLWVMLILLLTFTIDEFVLGEFLGLLPYLTLLVFFFVVPSAVARYKDMILKIFQFSVGVWLFVGIVQLVVAPEFLSGIVSGHASTENMLSSGRGVLSLAPEPTHYAYHLLILSAVIALFGGRVVYVYLGLAQSAVLALSSGGWLVLLLAFSFFVLMKRPLLFFLAGSFLFVLFSIFTDDFISLITVFQHDFRFLGLAGSLLDGSISVYDDYSVNVRILGLLYSLDYIASGFFIPFGISSGQWEISSQEILDGSSGLYGISSNGVPSGFGKLLYEAGFLFLPFFLYVCYRFIKVAITNRLGFVLLLPFFIACMQYSLSSPDLAFALIAILTRPIVTNRFGFQQREVANKSLNLRQSRASFSNREN